MKKKRLSKLALFLIQHAACLEGRMFASRYQTLPEAWEAANRVRALGTNDQMISFQWWFATRVDQVLRPKGKGVGPLLGPHPSPIVIGLYYIPTPHSRARERAFRKKLYAAWKKVKVDRDGITV